MSSPDPFVASEPSLPATEAGEVRRCPGCGAAAAICLSRYERTGSFGLVRLGASEVGDHVCQECGRAVTLHPTPWLLLAIAVPGAMFVPMGLFVAAAAFRGEGWFLVPVGAALVTFGVGTIAPFAWPWWTRSRWPVVPGAAVPPIRFRETQPGRRCRCGARARCTAVTASRTNGIYTGTEYGYACAACGREFTIDSPLSAALSFGGGGLLGGLGWALAPERLGEADWAQLAVIGVLGFLGVAGVVMALARGVARVRHPVT